MIDFKLARETMVESQLRTAGITDRRLLTAMGTLPRELFVAPENRSFAYMDGAVPIGAAGAGPTRYLMQPMVLARLLQRADIDSSERVLDVGCATGYSLAVLAELAGTVVGVESDASLASQAESNLAALKIANAKLVTGPLAEGAASDGPFDLIVLDGSVPSIPLSLVTQVREGGRIMAIVSSGEQGTAYLFTVTDGEASGLPQFAAGAAPLPGFQHEASFNF